MLFLKFYHETNDIWTQESLQSEKLVPLQFWPNY
jgi:hypothetical protein